MANRSFQSARADIYSRITDDIVAAIANGAGEWRMPWHHDGSNIARPRNVASDKAYRGINVLALWVATHRARHTGGIWGTYRQWAERGCQVRRGERATSVVFWRQMGRRDDGEPSSDDQDPSHDDRSGRARFFARGYQVFNQAQVDGHARIQQELPCLAESERIAHADTFFAALRVPIVFEGGEACYRPYIDTIFMRRSGASATQPAFYSCLAHETGHAVGHPSRLNRDLSGRFGSARYGMDEVVCELTASFVMADLGIAHRPRPEHAAYIGPWLPVLKSDSRGKGRQVTAVLSVDTSAGGASSDRAPITPPVVRRPRAPRSGDRRRYRRHREVVQSRKGVWLRGLQGWRKDVFVHISVVERAGLRGLEEDQRLAMKVVRTQKGREATALTLRN